MEVSDEILSTPLKRPTTPKTNHVNADPKLDDDYTHEADIEDAEYKTGDKGDDVYGYKDKIKDDQYDEEGMLPQPTVSSLRHVNTNLPQPTVSHGNLKAVVVNTRENMNIISSFRMKQE